MRDDDRPNAADRPGGPARPPTAPEPWDDERLTAAFSGRYDRPAPRDLTIATLERVAETRRRPRWWPRVDRPTRDRLVAAVAVVAVAAVVGVVALPRWSSRLGTTATGPAGSGTGAVPTSGQETPYQSFEPSPAMAGFGAVAVDLPVRSVADVSVILANPGLGDTELAFGGWYSAGDLALGCQDQGEPASPIQIRCTDIHAWLSSTDRPILSANGSFEQPANPADLLPLRFVFPMDPPQGEAGAGSWKVVTPRSVILIGHFHDERSSRCPADEQATCERTFVVDGIARATGELKDPSKSSTTTTTVAPRLTAVDAMRIAQARIAGYGQILSVGLAQGNDAPWFTAARNADCLCPPTWFVRGYRTVLEGDPDPRSPGTPAAAWMTIDDATGAILGPLTTGVPAPATPFPFAPPPDGFPATIEGMPVRTVADVVDPSRLAEPPDHPIAVAGWFTQLPHHPCEATADCNRETVVLAGSDTRLVKYGPGGSYTLIQPDAPIMNPAILPGGATHPRSGSEPHCRPSSSSTRATHARIATAPGTRSDRRPSCSTRSPG